MASYGGISISEKEAVALGAIVLGGAFIASKLPEIAQRFGEGFGSSLAPKSPTTTSNIVYSFIPSNGGIAQTEADVFSGIKSLSDLSLNSIGLRGLSDAAFNFGGGFKW